MKITRNKFKEIVRESLIENSEYQQFFQTALEKSGKSIPEMSDEEKKSFFDKIDAAWNGKGEKREVGEDCQECDTPVNESNYESKKVFAVNPSPIGKAKHSIDWADGKSKNKDGSPQIGIYTFKNKPDLEAKVKELTSNGYKKVNNVLSALRVESIKEALIKLDGKTYSDQTGIKSSITRSSAFQKIIGDSKIIRWAMSTPVKIYNWAGHGLIFTDGVYEMIVDYKSPMQLLVPMQKVRNEFRALYRNKTESVKEETTDTDRYGNTRKDGGVTYKVVDGSNTIESGLPKDVAQKLSNKKTGWKIVKESKITENQKLVVKKGNTLYVDSDFVNFCKGKLPNSELKHAGMGDFYLETPDGKITFDRVGEKFDGMSGRAHRTSDTQNGKLLAQLIKKMGATIINESITPLKKDRFYLDTRKNKTLRIFSVDGDTVKVEYFDTKTRKPTGKTDTYTKGEVEYWIKQGAWGEYKQPFLKNESMNEAGTDTWPYQNYDTTKSNYRQPPVFKEPMDIFKKDHMAFRPVVLPKKNKHGQPLSEKLIKHLMKQSYKHLNDILEFLDRLNSKDEFKALSEILIKAKKESKERDIILKMMKWMEYGRGNTLRTFITWYWAPKTPYDTSKMKTPKSNPPKGVDFY